MPGSNCIKGASIPSILYPLLDPVPSYMWLVVLLATVETNSVYAFVPSALCWAPNTSAKIFCGISLAIDNVKVSVALTAALTPAEPVTNNVLPVTIVWVVEPSDIVKPVPVILVLISLIATY